MIKTLQVFFLIFIAIILHSCSDPNRSTDGVASTIYGRISNLNDSSVILEEWKINEIIKVDEVALNKGEFSFNTTLNKGSMYLLKMGGYKLPIIADHDSIVIIGTSPEFKDIVIIGSHATNQLFAFTKQIDHVNDDISYNRMMFDSLSKTDVNDSIVKSFIIKHDQGLMELSNLIKGFADTTSYFQAALYSIRKLDPTSEVDFFDRFITNLPKRFADNDAARSFGDLMKENINKIQKTGISVGVEAPDFTLRDLDNHPVNLSEYRGNYVLLTFWASWCPPCRHENKYLIQLYDSFDNRNFKMVHISIDKDINKLKRAIAKDGLKWDMLNDPNEWDGNIVNLYGFQKIPANYVIDPEGKIVAKNVFGNELMMFVSQLYNTNVSDKKLD